MNDKQQLAAMGEYLAEQQQPICLQKRVAQLEVLLREVAPCVTFMINRIGDSDTLRNAERLADCIDEALDGVMVSKPSAPEGWKLVPAEVTLKMQHAYFGVIDKNMHRVETDCRFGRYDSAREAYRAMLAAAPECKP